MVAYLMWEINVREILCYIYALLSPGSLVNPTKHGSMFQFNKDSYQLEDKPFKKMNPVIFSQWITAEQLHLSWTNLLDFIDSSLFALSLY